MRVYRVEFVTSQDGSHGYDYFTSRREAGRAIREWEREHREEGDYASLEDCTFPPTGEGILQALKRWATHNDNG